MHATNLTKTFPADTAEDVAYSYDSTSGGNDGIGRLTGVADRSGTTAFVYNALGQIASDARVIGSNSYTAAYIFDPAGHPLTITYPSGRIVTYTRDALGRISSVTTKQNSGAAVVNVLTSATYEPFGGLSGGSFGNGINLAIGYDQDYELTSIVASGNVQNLAYGYDAASNITGITDNLNPARSQTLAYDDLNRVWCATGGYGTQAYTYNGVGNRTSLSAGGTIGTCPTMSGGTTSTYAIASGANQIATITTGSAVRTFGYLASGQVSGDQRTAASDYTFAYNNDGRMQTASLNSATAGTYLYNGFEQRVRKTVGSVVTDFVYDRFGHLLEEANDSTGAAIREYIWLDNLPVAMVDDTGSSPIVYYIHTDQLGSPQKMTDANDNVVWDGVYDPFGNMVASTGANWGTGIWGSFTWEPGTPEAMPLRFPGQYADAETALNQNWFRDYDPTIGRYVESDPVGILSGVNTYGFVLGNPLTSYDPTGTGIVGGAIGGGIGGLLGGAGGSVIGPEGTVAGGFEGAEEGYAIGSGIENVVDILMMAKGGIQNKENEYSRQARQQPDPCGWLTDQYNQARATGDTGAQLKIQTAQKALGCRNKQKRCQ